jgi:branched-chain amino acid transport system substrate-binding protein
LEKGGRTVEGLELNAVYDPQNKFPGFQPFVERFEARYNRPPDFAAAYAYESVLVLAEALKHTAGEADGLPEALTSIKNLEGVQGTISINEYGDVERDSYIAIIKDRQFEVIEVIYPTD